MVYKSLNDLAPDYLSNFFYSDHDSVTSYSLRDTESKLTSQSHTNYLE